MSELDDLGIPSEMVDARARQVLQQELGNIQALGQAVASMDLKHKDWGQVAARVGHEIDNNPKLRDYVSTDPHGGLEMAYQHVMRQQPQQQPAPAAAPAPPRQSIGPAKSPWHSHPGQVPLTQRDQEQAEVEAYARKRLRESIHHPGLDALEGQWNKIDPQGW